MAENEYTSDFDAWTWESEVILALMELRWRKYIELRENWAAVEVRYLRLPCFYMFLKLLQIHLFYRTTYCRSLRDVVSRLRFAALLFDSSWDHRLIPWLLSNVERLTRVSRRSFLGTSQTRCCVDSSRRTSRLRSAPSLPPRRRLVDTSRRHCVERSRTSPGNYNNKRSKNSDKRPHRHLVTPGAGEGIRPIRPHLIHAFLGSHGSAPSKRHLDQFSRFCVHRSKFFQCFSMERQPPKIALNRTT